MSCFNDFFILHRKLIRLALSDKTLDEVKFSFAKFAKPYFAESDLQFVVGLAFSFVAGYRDVQLALSELSSMLNAD